MSGAFTPGPWSMVNRSHKGKAVIAIDDSANDTFMIATCHGPDNEANAHLIAAAPDLLAALQNLMTWHDGNENVPPRHNGAEPWYWARDAIAKATGEAK